MRGAGKVASAPARFCFGASCGARSSFLVADPPHIASHLRFDVTPRGEFLGLAVNGRRVSFAENVFYRFQDGKIVEVWSVIDKAAIDSQL